MGESRASRDLLYKKMGKPKYASKPVKKTKKKTKHKYR